MRWKLQDNIVCMKGTVQCATAEDGDEAEYICDAHNAECDKYDAELAELRDKLEICERQRNEGACYFDELMAKRDKANRNLRDRLEGANDTLDALRDVMPEYEGDWQDWEPSDLQRLAGNMQRILYSDTTAPEDGAGALR